MKTIYDKAYFIAKFEAIPEEKWCVAYLDAGDGVHCALGHCGVTVSLNYTDKEIALRDLMRPNGWSVADINDGDTPDFQQPTPKQRILAALRSLP